MRLPALGFLLSACLASGMPRAENRAPSGGTISISSFQFAPPELTVSVGDTVSWTNDDHFMHTTTADSGAWASKELARGQRYVFVAGRAGRFPYHCAAHPVMRAVIVVRQ